MIKYFYLSLFLATCWTIPGFSQEIPSKGKLDRYENGQVKTAILSKEVTIEGYKFPEDSKIVFDLKGSLSSVKLGKDAELLHHIFPKESLIFFNHWGGRFGFWPSKAMTIHGHPLSARFDGIANYLYETSGNLKLFWLVDDEMIDGIPCTSSVNVFKYGLSVISKGTDRMVYLYENGKVQQAMLFDDITIKGRHFEKGNVIQIDENGYATLKRK